jgi:hypothetical protein
MKAAYALIAALALSACAATPSTPQASPDGQRLAMSDDLQCRILADVAVELGGDSFDPAVNSGSGDPRDTIDCTAAFKARGLPVILMGNPTDPRVNIAVQDHGWKFTAPQFLSDDEARVKVDFVCQRLCGHGEELTIRRTGAKWTIADRRTTWVA